MQLERHRARRYSFHASVELISHRSENFEALGKVTYARSNTGMGILFTRIEPHDQSVLDKWIAELRDQ